MLELSRDSCASQILRLVVALNHNRIYGRLGSSKYSRPSYHRGSAKEPLAEDLLKLYKRTRSGERDEFGQRKVFSSKLNDFHIVFQKMEALPAFQDSDAIIDVLEQAFKITSEDDTLSSRHKLLGFAKHRVQYKEILQLMKVANYKRVCYGLAEKARSFRKVFTTMYLELLTPYDVSYWNGRKRFVHAEIQVLIHYEKKEVHPRPRVIGASKEACFLCDSFIRAYERFQISKAHRHLYDMWTIPDLIEYEHSSRERLQQALSIVNQDLQKHRAAEQRGRQRRPYPLQSSVNLVKAAVRQASMSTIRSTGLSSKGTGGSISTVIQRHVSQASSTHTAHKIEKSSQYVSQFNDEAHVETTAETPSRVNSLSNRCSNLSRICKAPVVSPSSSRSIGDGELDQTTYNSSATHSVAQQSKTSTHRTIHALDHDRGSVPASQELGTSVPSQSTRTPMKQVRTQHKHRHSQRRDRRFETKIAEYTTASPEVAKPNMRFVRQRAYGNVKTQTRPGHNTSEWRPSRTRSRGKRRRQERSGRQGRHTKYERKGFARFYTFLRFISCLPRGRSSKSHRKHNRGLQFGPRWS